MNILPKTWRIVAQNASGVALGGSDSITVKVIRWKFDSSGVKTSESSEATVVSGGASLANNSYLTGTTQDNDASGTKWLGADVVAAATISTATPSGYIRFWLQESTDGGTTWPDNGLGEPLRGLYFTATGTKRDSFRL